MKQDSIDNMKNIILGEKHFSWLYHNWWHSSVPPFNFALALPHLIKKAPNNFILNTEQRQVIENIERNLREVSVNWSYVPNHAWPNMGIDHAFLEFFIKFWRDGFLPIENALTEIDVLLGGGFRKFEIDDEYVYFLRLGSYEILADWQLPLDYINLHYNFEKVWSLEATDLNKVIQETVNLLSKHRVLENVNVTLPSKYTQVIGNKWLYRAISYLIPFPKYASFRGSGAGIFRDDYGFLNSELSQWEVEDNPIAKVTVEEQESSALVKIHVRIASKRSTRGKIPLSEKSFNQGSFPAVASFIIERFDSKATFSWSDFGGTFQFKLPLWAE